MVWYNDLERGFNTSAFTTRGVIGEYWCEQGDFGDFLRTLPEAREAEVFAEQDPSARVPANLRGSGRIARRQTTYWDVQADTGAPCRIHFSDKQETGFVGAAYDHLELVDAHPLLVDYVEPWASVFVSRAQSCGVPLFDALTRRVRDGSDGWRSARSYGLVDATSRVLTDGDGLLLRAPESRARMVADVVREFGALPSLLPHMKARPGYRALLLGRSFVVASAFRFEG